MGIRKRSRRSRRRSRRYASRRLRKSKCKSYLAKKMKENMHKWKHQKRMKNGRYISTQKQAMAISYSQTKKKYPRCKLN